LAPFAPFTGVHGGASVAGAAGADHALLFVPEPPGVGNMCAVVKAILVLFKMVAGLEVGVTRRCGPGHLGLGKDDPDK